MDRVETQNSKFPLNMTTGLAFGLILGGSLCLVFTPALPVAVGIVATATIIWGVVGHLHEDFNKNKEQSGRRPDLVEKRRRGLGERYENHSATPQMGAVRGGYRLDESFEEGGRNSISSEFTQKTDQESGSFDRSRIEIESRILETESPMDEALDQSFPAPRILFPPSSEAPNTPYQILQTKDDLLISQKLLERRGISLSEATLVTSKQVKEKDPITLSSNPLDEKEFSQKGSLAGSTPTLTSSIRERIVVGGVGVSASFVTVRDDRAKDLLAKAGKAWENGGGYTVIREAWVKVAGKGDEEVSK